MTEAQPRIALLGSCVTRQAFQFREWPAEWRLDRPVHYQARTSLVSLLSPPLDPPEPLIAAIADPFEQRATRDDFQRNFWSRLRACDPDLLIIDLVDERFDLLAANATDGPRYATMSDQIVQWDHHQRRRAAKSLLRRLRRRLSDMADVGVQRFGLNPLRRVSSEVNHLWQGAAQGFAQRLRAEYPRLRVALHLAPLPTTFEDGSEEVSPGVFPWWQRYPQRLAALRAVLATYGRQLRQLFPEAPVLQVPRELHLLGRNHRWGEQPWHHADSYYRALAEQIRKLVR